MAWDMGAPSVAAGSVGTAGDPGGQKVVGVFREVVADEDVEQVEVAAHVGLGEHDQLTFAGADSEAHGAREVLDVAGEHRGGDEDGGGARAVDACEHLRGRVGVATDEAVEEGGRVNRHRTTVALGADDALTTD
jgi:hypothetical protein